MLTQDFSGYDSYMCYASIDVVTSLTSFINDIARYNHMHQTIL
jgi:hypothetical protein